MLAPVPVVISEKNIYVTNTDENCQRQHKTT